MQIPQHKQESRALSPKASPSVNHGSRSGSTSAARTAQSGDAAGNKTAPPPTGDEVHLFTLDEVEEGETSKVNSHKKGKSRSNLDDVATLSVKTKKQAVNTSQMSGGEGTASTVLSATTCTSGNLKVVPIEDEEIEV